MDEDVNRSAEYMRKIIQWLIILGVLVAMAFSVFNIIQGQLIPRVAVTVGSTTVHAEIADTPDTRKKGLGGRSGISSDRAMLFVYDRDDELTMWMKGMKFPIDIVWLDSEKRVVHYVENVQPDAEPYEKYTPTSPARYVLELQAGMVERAGIKIGIQSSFNLEQNKE